MKKIFFSICMLAAMSSVVLTSCKDEDVAGAPAPTTNWTNTNSQTAVTPAQATTTAQTNAGVQTAAIAAATTEAIQTAGVTNSTDGAGNAVETTVAAPTTNEQTGAQTQVVTVVTKDESGTTINTVETTTTVEASATNEPGAKITQVEVTKDADGKQIGEAKTTYTDYTYTYTVAGKTYNTTAELQAALAKLPAGTTATVVATLTKTTTVNDEVTNKEVATASTEVNIPLAGQTFNENLNIPSTVSKAEGSQTEAAATQEVSIAVTKEETTPEPEPQHNGGETND